MSKWQSIPGREDIKLARYVVPNFASNSLWLKASNGDHYVISPGTTLLKDFADENPKLVQNGGLGLRLVLPNGYHYLGAQAWLTRFPNAKLYASVKASRRLSKKLSANVNLLSDSEIKGVPEARWVQPPGHRGGDIWLVCQHQDGWLWVTCDSFLNYPRFSNKPIARLMQKLLGAAPGLKMSAVVKYFILDDRKAFKKWLWWFLRRFPPTMLIPSHGDPIESKMLDTKLRKLVAGRI